MARSKDRAAAVEILLKLRESIDEQCAEWLIEVFCVRLVHRELLLECPVSEVRKFIIILLKTAINLVGESFKVKLFLSLAKDLRLCQSKYSRFFYQYLQLLHHLYTNITAAGVEIPHVNAFMFFTNHLFALKQNFEEIPDPELQNTDVYLGYNPSTEVEKAQKRGISHFIETSTSSTYLIKAVTDAVDVD